MSNSEHKEGALTVVVALANALATIVALLKAFLEFEITVRKVRGMPKELEGGSICHVLATRGARERHRGRR